LWRPAPSPLRLVPVRHPGSSGSMMWLKKYLVRVPGRHYTIARCWTKSGPLTKIFLFFFEDVDLAFRARLAGWKCVYVPTARVVHIHGGTANPGSDAAVYYGHRNTLRYVVKNFPSRIFIIYFPWILGRNCAVIPYYFLSGKFQMIVRAKVDAIKGFPRMIRKRRCINKNVHSRTIEKWIHVWSSFRKS